MCNSSFQTNISVSDLMKSLQWECICQEQFGGPHIVAILTGFFFICGSPISALSLWMILRKKLTANLVMSLNIVFLEVCFSFLSLFDLILSYVTPVPNYLLIVFFVALHWTVRPLLQICLCLEHYLAVVHPVMFLRYRSIQYRNAAAAGAWIIAVINSLRLIFIEEPIFPDHVFLLIFCVAFSIITFCCLSVLHALRDPGPGDRNDVETAEKNRQKIADLSRVVENKQKRRAFRIISHILLAILICYIPQGAAYLLIISEANTLMYICNTFPIILLVTIITILLSPLMKMYSEGQFKNCFFQSL